MKKLIVHRFTLSDVDDIEIYAAEPLYKFEISEKGRWVLENAIEKPVWHQRLSHEVYGFQIEIEATLSDELATYFQLKWDPV